MANTSDLKSDGRKTLRVQFPLPAPKLISCVGCRRRKPPYIYTTASERVKISPRCKECFTLNREWNRKYYKYKKQYDLKEEFVNELDKHNLRGGSRVKMKYFDSWAYGEVTIVTETTCKVLFDGDFDLDYTYYPIAELELVEE